MLGDIDNKNNGWLSYSLIHSAYIKVPFMRTRYLLACRDANRNKIEIFRVWWVERVTRTYNALQLTWNVTSSFKPPCLFLELSVPYFVFPQGLVYCVYYRMFYIVFDLAISIYIYISLSLSLSISIYLPNYIDLLVGKNHVIFIFADT